MTITVGLEPVTSGIAKNNCSIINCFSAFLFVLSVYLTALHSLEDLNKWL